MNYILTTKTESELYHHGVKGQKWGVRRYQDKSGRLTSAGRNRYLKRSGQTSKGVTDRDKEKNRLTQGAMDSPANEIKDLPRLKSRVSATESMKVVNPGFPKRGCDMNCVSCTAAMALREKGYDVKSVKMDSGTYPDLYYRNAFNGSDLRRHKVSNLNELSDSLSEYGDGAYGSLSVNWKVGGNHTMFWKNENGKTRVYDGQCGEEMTSSSYSRWFDDAVDYEGWRPATFRLDNVDPNDRALALIQPADKKERRV